MDELVINATMDVKGFLAGTQRLNNAIKSFGTNVDKAMRNVQGASKGILSTMMKWGPALLGVGGAYSIISKSVSAFMAQNQQLSNTLQACWNSIGGALGPIIEKLVGLIAQAVQYLMAFLKLLGVSTANSKSAGKAAGGAAQELKKQLMGFDELNVLQDNKNSGGGGAGTLAEIEAPEWMKKFADWLTNVWDLLKEQRWDEAADMIVDGMNKLIYTFRDKAEELGDKIGVWLGGALHVVARVLDEVDWHALGEGVANLVNGLMNRIDGEDIGKLLVAKFTIAFKALTGFLEALNWAWLGQIVFEAIRGALNSIERAINTADFKKIGAGIRTFFEQLDWIAIRDAILGVLSAAWNSAIDLLWGIIAGDSKEEPPVIGSLRKLGKAIEDIVVAATPYLKTLLDKILEFSSTAIKTAIDEITSLLTNLADMLNGKKSFAEFWGDLSAVQSNIALIAAGMLTIKGVLTAKTFFDSIGNFMFKTQGAAEAADKALKGTATAAGEAAAGVDTATKGVEMSAGGVLTLAAGMALLTNEAYKEHQQYKKTVDETVNTLERQASVTTGITSELYSLNAEYERARGVLDDWSSTTGNQIAASIRLKDSYDSLVSAAKNYSESLRDTVSEENAVQVYGELSHAIDVISQSRDEYYKKGLNTKQIDEVLNGLIEQQTEIQNKYNVSAKEANVLFESNNAIMQELVRTVDNVSREFESGKMTSESARQSYAELAKVVQTLENQYGDSVGDMQLYKDVQELMKQISDEYNITLDDQSQILKDTKETIKESATETQNSAKAAEDAAKATTEAKKSQEEMTRAMDGAKQESQRLVTESKNVENEMNNLADTGTKSADELTTGYTETVARNAPEMAKTTTDAGSEAGKGLEAGLDEVDAAQLAEEYTDKFKSGIEQNTPKVEQAAKDMAQKTVDVTRQEVERGTTQINQIISTAVNQIAQTIQNCGNQINQAVQQSTNVVVDSFQMMQNTITTAMSQVNQICSQVFNNLVQLSGQAGEAIARNYAAGMTQMYSTAVNVATQLNSTLGNYFGQIAQNGYIWGKDLGILFNNGLVDACNAYLIPTLQQVAQSIKNVIGFSKPKEGPLSDADTYMPDFMRLLASGIESYEDEPLNAVANLAEGVKDELENGDYNFGDFEANELDTAFSGFADQFLNGFGSLIDRLDAIADRVIYKMPDVATGNVLPYSVSSENAQNAMGSVSDVSEIVNAINGLRTLLTQNNGENTGFNITVLLDGEQIEAAVSTRQRRKKIAQGV